MTRQYESYNLWADVIMDLASLNACYKKPIDDDKGIPNMKEIIDNLNHEMPVILNVFEKENSCRPWPYNFYNRIMPELCNVTLSSTETRLKNLFPKQVISAEAIAKDFITTYILHLNNNHFVRGLCRYLILEYMMNHQERVSYLIDQLPELSFEKQQTESEKRKSHITLKKIRQVGNKGNLIERSFKGFTALCWNSSTANISNCIDEEIICKYLEEAGLSVSTVKDIITLLLTRLINAKLNTPYQFKGINKFPIYSKDIEGKTEYNERVEIDLRGTVEIFVSCFRSGLEDNLIQLKLLVYNYPRLVDQSLLEYIDTIEKELSTKAITEGYQKGLTTNQQI